MNDRISVDMAAFFIVVLLPLALFVLRGGRTDRDSFLTNQGNNRFVVVTLGAVAGNIGIGTFVVLFLFSSESPLVGFSVATAYGIGLLICSALAGPIRVRSRDLGTTGIVEFITVGNEVRHPLAVWLCVALVFIIRSAVHITALAVVISELTDVAIPFAIVISVLLTGFYSIVGGYRAAVLTDMVQSTLLLFAMALLAFFFLLDGDLWNTLQSRDFFDLGSYEPVFLAGIWILLPAAPLLAVDNWHRITTANTDGDARLGFLVAAFCCVPVYVLVCLFGMSAEGTDVIAVMADALPNALSWVAYAAVAAAIMSSVDTFIVPLTSTLSRGGMTLGRLRLLLAALFALAALIAITVGSVLDAVVAAFNSMVVLLPALIAVFIDKYRSGSGALWSIVLGTATSIAVTLFDPQRAAIAGFIVACFIQGLFVWRRRALDRS